MIQGLSHLTFVVRDLDRFERLVLDVLGGARVYDSGNATFSLSRERFFVAGGLWLAAMEGEPSGRRGYDHVAFKIAEEDYDACLARIRALGLALREGRPRVEGEGRSLYFHDDDDHLFELHTGTLDERLERYGR